MTIKMIVMVILVLFLSFFQSMGSQTAKTPVAKESEKAAEPQFASCLFSPRTTNGVSEFERLLKKRPYMLYEDDYCHEITPSEIKKKSDYKIFKYGKSCASFLMHKRKVYQLGECFGGFGIVDAKLADLNHDGKDELYFTFSWGSGLHRSQVGYFDPVQEKIVIFEYSHLNNELVFDINVEGELCLYGWMFGKQKKICSWPLAKIFYRNDKIELNSVGLIIGEMEMWRKNDPKQGRIRPVR